MRVFFKSCLKIISVSCMALPIMGYTNPTVLLEDIFPHSELPAERYTYTFSSRLNEEQNLAKRTLAWKSLYLKEENDSPQTQKWIFEDSGNGYYFIKNASSSESGYLRQYFNSKTVLTVPLDKNSWGFYWTLEEENGVYHIKNRLNQQYLRSHQGKQYVFAADLSPSWGYDWYIQQHQQAITTGSTWQWQLSGEVNTEYQVNVYDIDLFDSPLSLISELKQRDIQVICYFSAGSREDWREGALYNNFPESAIGNPLGDWEGEHWLDIRNETVRETMKNRLDLAVEKGCDGVEPDNVDAYSNSSGFDLSEEDQIDYNEFLAHEAHQRNLSIGLKNAVELIPHLVDQFDFAVNEQCVQYEECSAYQAFTQQNKAVFHSEYSDSNNPLSSAEIQKICEISTDLNFNTLILNLELDDSLRITCL